MALFKVSYKWKQQSTLEFGWSENFWWSGSDINACGFAARTLLTALNLVHGNQAFCPTIRISTVGLFRSVLNIDTGFGPTPTSATYDADYPNTALLLKVSSLTTFTRQWLKGIPDVLVANGGRYQNGTAVQNNINALLGIPGGQGPGAAGPVGGALSGGKGWCIYHQNAAALPKQIQSVTAAGVATINNHGFLTAANSKIRVSKMAFPTTMNRVWGYTIIDANTVQLLGWSNPLAKVPIVGAASTATQQVKQFEAITTSVVVRATSHKTGRPFGLAGGRRTRPKTQAVGLPVAV